MVTAAKVKKGYVKNLLKNYLLKPSDTLDGVKRTDDDLGRAWVPRDVVKLQTQDGGGVGWGGSWLQRKQPFVWDFIHLNTWWNGQE